MIRILLCGIFCAIFLVSLQTVYAQEELELPEGKNIKQWESIGIALVGEKRFEESIIYFDKILDKEPKNLKALSNKAGVLIQLNQSSESLKISDKVLKIDPERISTLTNKAIALKMLKEYEKSFITFSQILVLEPENENVKKARANLLSSTPTINTKDSRYDVHTLLTIRNIDGSLVAVIESTNARYLPSIFTEKWWDMLDKEGKIMHSDGVEILQLKNNVLPEDNYLGMATLERVMSGYNVAIFENFHAMIEIEKTDVATIQWTIIKN